MQAAEQKKPTPIKGDRKLFCHNYSECLSKAVELRWKAWSCLECLIEPDKGLCDSVPISLSYDERESYLVPRRIFFDNT